MLTSRMALLLGGSVVVVAQVLRETARPSSLNSEEIKMKPERETRWMPNRDA